MIATPDEKYFARIERSKFFQSYWMIFNHSTNISNFINAFETITYIKPECIIIDFHMCAFKFQTLLNEAECMKRLTKDILDIMRKLTYNR